MDKSQSCTPNVLSEFQRKKKTTTKKPPNKAELAEGRQPPRNHATCWRTMWLLHKSETDLPCSLLILSRRNLSPPLAPFKMQQLFPIELLLLPLLLAFNKAQGYQRVKEKLPWLCRSPDCAIRAVREVLYKGRARGRARWRLALPP